MDRLLAMAETYKMWVQGWAYIPAQDIVRYEMAYKLIYEQDRLNGTIIVL